MDYPVITLYLSPFNSQTDRRSPMEQHRHSFQLDAKRLRSTYLYQCQVSLPLYPTIRSSENPTGIYRLEFDMPRRWMNQDGATYSFLLHGVESACFILYLNRELLGFSKDSHLPCEVDATRHLLKDEHNILARNRRHSLV